MIFSFRANGSKAPHANNLNITLQLKLFLAFINRITIDISENQKKNLKFYLESSRDFFLSNFTQKNRESPIVSVCEICIDLEILQNISRGYYRWMITVFLKFSKICNFQDIASGFQKRFTFLQSYIRIYIFPLSLNHFPKNERISFHRQRTMVEQLVQAN